jgi:low temperature requirement protein LtrA
VSAAEREHERDAEHQVTPLELFFDLVLVFAITQVTKLLATDPTCDEPTTGPEQKPAPAAA